MLVANKIWVPPVSETQVPSREWSYFHEVAVFDASSYKMTSERSSNSVLMNHAVWDLENRRLTQIMLGGVLEALRSSVY